MCRVQQCRVWQYRVWRLLVLGLMVALLVECYSGVAFAQQAARTDDPFAPKAAAVAPPLQSAKRTAPAKTLEVGGALDKLAPDQSAAANVPKKIRVPKKVGQAQEAALPAQGRLPGKGAVASSIGISVQGMNSLANARIRKALSKPIEIAFNDAPLADVIAYLREVFNVAIVIDRRALDDVGLGSDTPVTVSLKGISLRSALRLILGELDLTYVVRDEVLKITTPEEAENELDTRLYDVADLAYEGKPPVLERESKSRFTMVLDMISSTIAPDTWGEVGGAGSMTPYDPWRMVAISQTDEVHAQIEALLATIRRGRKATPKADNSVGLRADGELDWKASERIQQALGVEVSLDFVDAPLSEVAAFIEQQYRIPVIIDRRALDDCGLGSDTPVTISVSGVSLRSGLRLLLKELDLTYTIENEVLKITTPEAAEYELEIRVYPVHDFLDKQPGTMQANRSAGNLRALSKLLTSSIAPDSWDIVGGAGTAEVVVPWGLLIVSQVHEVHVQTAGLLAAARRVRQQKAPDATPKKVRKVVAKPANPFAVGEGSGFASFGNASLGNAVQRPEQSTMVLKPYELRKGVSAEEVMALVKGTVEQRSWLPRSRSAAVFAVGPTLFIRQTRAAHTAIQELLQSAGLLGGGGSGGGVGPGGCF